MQFHISDFSKLALSLVLLKELSTVGTEKLFKVNSSRTANFLSSFFPRRRCFFPRVDQILIDQKAGTERGVVDSVWY